MTTKPRATTRLHHNAHVTTDMEAVRKFYEEIIGFPLVATWCEVTDLFGKERTYMHCFFDIGNGYEAPDTYPLDHGYCYSLYVKDPADLLIEFTVDDADVEQINKDQLAKAHSELARWLAGDHAPNNEAYHR